MSDMRDLNQYLQSRNGRWHYVRRIPKPYLQVDNRAMIRKSLRTASLEVARARRDALVEADNQYWSKRGKVLLAEVYARTMRK